MDDVRAVDARCSPRGGAMTTDGLVDRNTLRRVLALAAASPSIQNSQPWRWAVGRRTVHLHTADALPATDTRARDVLVSCGAALHHLRVALAASGHASLVQRMPDPG